MSNILDEPLSTTPVKKKKGPGRPRKNPKKEPIPRKGISQIPTKADHVMETLYSVPIIWKKVLTFFRSLATNQIQILFRPNDIILYGVDHFEKSKIRVRIDASKLNHYYCAEEINIGIMCKDLGLVLNKIDKDYNSIILLSNKTNVRKFLEIILTNDIQIDESHVIDLIGTYDQMDNEDEFCDEDYTIKFDLPGKYFRKTINDVKTISTQVSFIQEDKDMPFEIGYTSKNKKIRSTHTIKNNNKSRINFVEKLEEDESFRVDVKVDYIKPISSSHIAEKISILVDENKRFMTKALLDNGTIEIKTLTEIINDRPE